MARKPQKSPKKSSPPAAKSAPDARPGAETQTPGAPVRRTLAPWLDKATPARILLFFAALHAVLLPSAWLVRQHRLVPVKAEAAWEAGDWRTAAENYATMTERKPGNSTYRLRWAESLLESGRAEQALEAMQPLFEIPATAKNQALQAERLGLRARAESLTGDADAALASAQAALKLDPEQPFANAVVAEQRLRGDDPTGAVQYFQNISQNDAYRDRFPNLKQALRDRILDVDPALLADVPEQGAAD